MKTWMVIVILPAVLAWSTLTTDDGFERERKPTNAAAKDALEGKPPPALAVDSWLNVADKTKGLDWDQLKGKVVVIDFWGTW